MVVSVGEALDALLKVDLGSAAVGMGHESLYRCLGHALDRIDPPP